MNKSTVKPSPVRSAPARLTKRVAKGLGNTFPAAAILLAMFACATACTTTPDLDPKTLPQSLRVQFEPCTPREGGAELALRHKGKLVASNLTLDFVSKGQDQLAAELSNPLGQTLFALSLTPPSQQVKFSRKIKTQVAVDDAGFLTVDGTTVGLKLSELLCGFGAVWPEAWLSQLTSFKLNAAKTNAALKIEDDRRTIALSLPLDGTMPKRCAEIKVRYALGLHTERLSLCLEPDRGLGSIARVKPAQTLSWAVISD